MLRNKTARRVTVRIPFWVERRLLRANVSGQDRPLDWMGNHLVFADLRPTDVITMTFPVPCSTGSYSVNYNSPKQQTFKVAFRGSTVVEIGPRETDPLRVPIYRRDHMKAAAARSRPSAASSPTAACRTGEQLLRCLNIWPCSLCPLW